MKRIIYHPLFVSGLAIRLILIVGMIPLAITIWFEPFLNLTTSSATINPWTTWIESGGTPVAFPYGYAMWFTFLPSTLLAKSLNFSTQYAYSLTLLVADFALLLGLEKLIPGKQRLLLFGYWLSPIAIITSYVLGLNDLIPILFLILSIESIRKIRVGVSSLLLSLAISAKLSMLLALPFYLIFLFNNKAMRQKLPLFLLVFGLSTALLFLPFVNSTEWLTMIVSNPKVSSTYQASLNVGSQYVVYILPLIYLIVLYLVWGVRRLNFILFQSSVGIAFLIVTLFTPSSPGWLLWVLPFLVIYQSNSDRISIPLVSLFSVLFTTNIALISPIRIAKASAEDLEKIITFQESVPNQLTTFLHTAMFAIGLILVIRIWRDAIIRNDFFRLSRKPFVLGIAGNTNSGKKTFTDSIIGLFGNHTVVNLNSDNYHLWDKQKPIWQVMTRLNPMTNDLEGFCNDLISLTDGKSIVSGQYDRKTGIKSKPLRTLSNDFIVASGLHALYLPIVRECCDLKIYLDTDDELRDYFSFHQSIRDKDNDLSENMKLKNKIRMDSEKFIKPQSTYSDIIMSLQPVNSTSLEETKPNKFLRLKLEIFIRNGVNVLSIQRALVGICGLHVDIVLGCSASDVQLSVEGDASSEDIAVASTILCPRIIEFLDVNPRWESGMLGLMQLITLFHINNTMVRRFII